ncbi:MAG: ISAs1 family transposase [Waddliaceae bacterium]
MWRANDKKKFGDESLKTLEQSHEELKNAVERSFGSIKDPRSYINRKHKLIDIIFITICAVIGGADNLSEVVTFADTHRNWFSKIIDLPYGIPSCSVFWWMFVLIQPEVLQASFKKWILLVTNGKLGEHVAIDGKALRGSASKGSSFIHTVSAWASDFQITLAQEKVDCKSNEITAIPEVLKKLNVEGATVTIDAMGTQKKIAGQIREQGADYILAVKGNQESIHDEVENFFVQAEQCNFEGIEHDIYREESGKEEHGRIEKRTVYATSEIDWLPQKKDWKDLQSIVMVVSERIINGQASIEKRMYISSRKPDAKKHGYFIRGHWGIESCHWILDVSFFEDKSKMRTGHLPENFSMIRRIALSLLKQDKRTKGSIKAKRKRAGWCTNYLEKVLNFIKSLA